jgi:CRP-like cAMP-binding protein
MQELLDQLDSIYPLSPELRQHLISITKHKVVRKREYLLKAGQVNREIHFIHKGLLWCYYSKEEKDFVSWFMKEGDMIASVSSFYDQVKSVDYIQAIEDCELYYITYEELEEVYHTFAWFNYNGRVLTVKYLKFFEEKAKGLRGLTPEKKYAWMLEKEPEILLRIPSRYLAAHLGINETMLSRIRGRR